MKRTIVAAAAAGWMATAAMATDSGALLSQGKLDADLGRHEQAATAFQRVADDAHAPAASRGEALLRLGLLRRQMGDAAGANSAFQRVWSEHRGDKEAMRQLVHAITGATPAGHYWDDNWQGVVLVVDEAGPRLEWPGQAPGRRPYQGEPISIDTKDGDLGALFRMFADASGLNVVVFPGVHGKVTYTAHEVPWDQALHAILAPQGLDYRWTENVLTIARPKDLGTARAGSAPPPKRYTGSPVSVDFKNADLRSVMASLAEAGEITVTFAPTVNGKVTLKLHEVPWDQAFDLVAKTNGIAWTSQGNARAVHQRNAVPTGDQLPYQAGRLETAPLDQVHLRGIVQKGAGYTAILLLPDGKVGFATAGARLQDAEIKAVDATTVTVRRNDGTESRQSLYPR